ncbi:MAG: YggT family protein [Acidimicrobiia bacterium]|nr:YggT family protein [Acidimicrobiia bacterium]
MGIRSVICGILLVYMVVLLLTAVLSWFPLTYDSPVHKFKKGLDALSEPILAPLRRTIRPVQFGQVGLDLSFLILFLAVFLARQLLCG